MVSEDSDLRIYKCQIYCLSPASQLSWCTDLHQRQTVLMGGFSTSQHLPPSTPHKKPKAKLLLLLSEILIVFGME